MQSSAVLQFETWSREESSFRAESLNADRKRQHVEESLNQMRLQQKKLSNEARESVDQLGRFHRDCGLLEKEKERLLTQLKTERMKLEKCSHDGENLLLQETTMKTVYQENIKAAISELNHLHLLQEDNAFRSVLSISTASKMLGFFQSVSEFDQENIAELASHLAEWIKIKRLHNKSIDEIESLQENIFDHRVRALGMVIRKGNDFVTVTEAVLDEMERTWDDSIDGEFNSKFHYGQMTSSQDDVALS